MTVNVFLAILVLTFVDGSSTIYTSETVVNNYEECNMQVSLMAQTLMIEKEEPIIELKTVKGSCAKIINTKYL